MKTQDKTSIFDGLSQHAAIDPETIRPIYDRVLVRDLGDAERIGSIFIPECARDQVQLRIGVVVAVGPGDAWTEHGLDAQGEPRRRSIKRDCHICGGGGRLNYFQPPERCTACDGTGKLSRWFDIRTYKYEKLRLPMICKPGDRIVFDRRREAELYIDGQRYSLCHEEQSVFAVLED